MDLSVTIQSDATGGIDWAFLRSKLVVSQANSGLPPSIKLPVLPKALMDFNRKAEDPNAAIDDLSKIVASDSGLSSDLLRHANSARTGTKAAITSVRHALVTLGVKATRQRLMTEGMKSVMKSSSSQLINFQSFWNANLERALFAREFAKLINADSDLAFTASLLQDFLLPAITNQLIDNYLGFLEAAQNKESLVGQEQQEFGWNHAQAAGTIMHAWHFPDALVCCVSLHHFGEDLLDHQQLKSTAAPAVALSSLIPDALRQEPRPMERLFELEEKVPGFDLLKLAEVVDTEFKAIAQNSGNHFSLLRTAQRALERQKQGEV